MTVATILFSIWHREIMEALELDVHDFEKTNRNNRRKVQRVLRYKAGPLALMAAATVFCFLPNWLSIVISSVDNYRFHGWHGLGQYSSVNTALCLVILCIGGLACHSLYLCIRLYLHGKKLSGGQKIEASSARSIHGSRMNH